MHRFVVLHDNSAPSQRIVIQSDTIIGSTDCGYKRKRRIAIEVDSRCYYAHLFRESLVNVKRSDNSALRSETVEQNSETLGREYDRQHSQTLGRLRPLAALTSLFRYDRYKVIPVPA